MSVSKLNVSVSICSWTNPLLNLLSYARSQKLVWCWLTHRFCCCIQLLTRVGCQHHGPIHRSVVNTSARPTWYRIKSVLHNPLEKQMPQLSWSDPVVFVSHRTLGHRGRMLRYFARSVSYISCTTSAQLKHFIIICFAFRVDSVWIFFYFALPFFVHCQCLVVGTIYLLIIIYYRAPGAK